MAGATTTTRTAVREIERLRVSPPPGSVSSTDIELSYFDVIWVGVDPVTRLFFFRLPDALSTHEFRYSHFPALAEALSLALEIFFPLAGRLASSPDDPDDFVISYVDGDSVPLTLAESASPEHFETLIGNQMRGVEELHPLVPVLPAEEPDRKPLLALQVTVFPGSGVCLGIAVHHAVADGTGTVGFVKSWASIFKAGGDASVVKTIPSFDRAVVGYLRQLKRDFVDLMKRVATPKGADHEPAQPVRLVLATFVLTRSHLEKLRDLVSSSGRDVGARPSTFQLTYAYTWVCAVEARRLSERETVHAAFVADLRTRVRPPVPDNFFGNCIGAIFAEGSGAELSGKIGIAVGSELIHRATREAEKDPMRDALSWVTGLMERSSKRVLSVAGSPRLRVYETDFGWGPPMKVEILSILNGGAISLAENRDEHGGVEIGFGGPQPEVELFASVFQEGLRCL
ncbi:hypothetical protein H6P81_011131 [Aristolochia fimbriata]|uniref:Uncharacterized protein n=1 Tax=Aristolochia fimbriata TaxID=158543 RepID=A0AAV7ETJ0_ARIFI|nr:hypothetical protein H6P81_011131 [Aristolochia fimbriata]